ncbi:hypothetical protein FHE73_28670 (plasmid) [Bacillus thuringiensis]|nr:hypothetical protein FHE73_28670 [Bacillus thuringiensis]
MKEGNIDIIFQQIIEVHLEKKFIKNAILSVYFYKKNSVFLIIRIQFYFNLNYTLCPYGYLLY